MRARNRFRPHRACTGAAVAVALLAALLDAGASIRSRQAWYGLVAEAASDGIRIEGRPADDAFLAALAGAGFAVDAVRVSADGGRVRLAVPRVRIGGPIPEWSPRTLSADGRIEVAIAPVCGGPVARWTVTSPHVALTLGRHALGLHASALLASPGAAGRAALSVRALDAAVARGSDAEVAAGRVVAVAARGIGFTGGPDPAATTALVPEAALRVVLAPRRAAAASAPASVAAGEAQAGSGDWSLRGTLDARPGGCGGTSWSGALRVRLGPGWEAALRAARDAGLVAPGRAQAAIGVLGLLAAGHAPPVFMLSIGDGQVGLGAYRVGALP